MVIVDSSVWIEASRPKGDLHVKVALESLLEEYEAAFCGPVKLEVLGAARQEMRKPLSFFFDIIPYVPMKDSVWESAKKMSWKLRDSGVTVPWNDVVIATIAIENNCRVYSLDKHFQEISRLTGLALYKASYGGSYDPGTS
ncbi:MAG TPA: PIN domain-containing protein [Chthoniobacterales bacterium]|jgi:hypothetical protein